MKHSFSFDISRTHTIQLMYGCVHQVASFRISMGSISSTCIDDRKCNMIKNSVVNEVRRQHIFNVIGEKFDKCYFSYIITRNDKHIAEVLENVLDNTITVSCHYKYRWKHTTINSTTVDIRDEDARNILNTLCISEFAILHRINENTWHTTSRRHTMSILS